MWAPRDIGTSGAGVVTGFSRPASQRAERERGYPVAPHVGTPAVQELGRAAKNGKWAKNEGMRPRRIVFFFFFSFSIFLFFLFLNLKFES
jgi:hypothetical protein